MALIRTQVRWTFPAGSGGGVNTWHMRTQDSPGGYQADVEALMEIVRTFYTSVMAICPSSSTVAWDGSAQEIGAAPEFQEPSPAWSVGGIGTGYGAAAGMGCVTWYSTLANRRGRGRTFIGPIASAAVEGDGTLTSAALSALRNGAAGLVSSSQSAVAGSIGVYSQRDRLLRDIVGARVTDEVAILRSRRG